MTRGTLTERQQQVFDIIRETVRTRGTVPTHRELMARLGVRSTNAITDHLRLIERKGWIEFNEPTPGVRHRGYRLASAITLDLSDLSDAERDRVASYVEHVRASRAA